MLAPSLRRQLAGWLAVVTLLSTAIIFVAVYKGTGDRLRNEVDQEISADAGELAHRLDISGARTPAQLLAVGARYVRTRPFAVNSTLLLVRVPGAGTATNQPELFANGPPDEGRARRNRTRRTVSPPGCSPLRTATRRFRSRTSGTCASTSRRC